MKQINFIVKEMTYFRYFIPLVIEANKRNIKSNFFIGNCGKYNSPHLYKDTIEEYSKKYNFELRDISSLEDNGYPFFLIEGVQSSLLSGFKSKKYSLTYMTDYVGSYDRYIESVDSVVMPSKHFAEYYNKTSNKNVYLGSPKYDITIDNENTIKKYNLTKNKKALFIFPRRRDLSRIDLLKIYDVVAAAGFELLVKSRGKDPAPPHLRGDYYFEDESWFPHTTMELISLSDLIINFDSTVIKECILLKKPFINFHIKPFDIRLDFLYKYKYCKAFNSDYDVKNVEKAIEYLTNKNFNSEFDMVVDKYLFEKGNVSAKILDYFGIH